VIPQHHLSLPLHCGGGGGSGGGGGCAISTDLVAQVSGGIVPFVAILLEITLLPHKIFDTYHNMLLSNFPNYHQ